MSRVTCTCCHRVETWSDKGVVVEMEGGVRRPTGDPELATLISALEVYRDGHRVVGSCSECGQLLKSDDEGLPWISVTSEGIVGELTVDERGLTGAELTVDEAIALLTDEQQPTLREELEGAGSLPIVALLGVPPFLLWLSAIGFLWAFYTALMGPDAPLVEFPMPMK